MHLQEVFNAMYKNHHYEYLIINRALEVVEFSDRIIDYCDEKLLKSESIDLFLLVPEFYGLEEQFEELFTYKREFIEIPQVRKGKDQYVNLSIQQGRVDKHNKVETLVVLFENITENVLMHQLSVQDRNEKELLLYEVEKKNLKLQEFNEHMMQLVEVETKKRIKFVSEYEKALQHGTLFCRMTSEGAMTMSSQAFEKLLGYKEEELLKMKYIQLLEASQANFAQKVVHKKLEVQKEWHGIIKHQHKTGEILHLQSSYVPIIDVDGVVEEIICLFVDLTENIRLNEDIITTQREVISTMGAIGETRSKETGDHVLRVAEYSRLFAIKSGLSIEEAEDLKMVSPMHDIGKVGIEDAILNKPGKLTEAEFEIMKTHARLGYEMLSGSNQKLLQTAAIVAHEHHEKWDGSGYPRGLCGEDIHIYGRITAIADVFDALGHDRVYKSSWPLESVLELLENERGKHFDPNLIDLFLENLDEFLEIKERFNGQSKDEA